jgi:hypothetical protein
MGGHAAIEFVRAALAGQIVRCAHLKSSIVIAVCASAIEPGDQPRGGLVMAHVVADQVAGDVFTSSPITRSGASGSEAPQSRRKIGRERANLAGGTLLAKDRRIFACPGWHPSRVCAILPPGSSATASLSVEELCSASIPRSELRRCACG